MIIIMISMIRMIIRLKKKLNRKKNKTRREIIERERKKDLDAEEIGTYPVEMFSYAMRSSVDIKFREADWFWLRNGLASVTGIKNDLKRRRVWSCFFLSSFRTAPGTSSVSMRNFSSDRFLGLPIPSIFFYFYIHARLFFHKRDRKPRGILSTTGTWKSIEKEDFLSLEFYIHRTKDLYFI